MLVPVVTFGEFSVTDGQCSTQGSCFLSPGYPGHYWNDQHCDIRVDKEGFLDVQHFDTEYTWDVLTVDGIHYSGGRGPSGVHVTPDSIIRFETDGTTAYAGFKICMTGCSTFTCDSGWVPKPNAAALPGEDRATCCDELCASWNQCPSGWQLKPGENVVGHSQSACCEEIMCSNFTCGSGWVPKPNAAALPGEDRATCCQEACEKELYVRCRFVDVCGTRGLATCGENHRCKCNAGYCANSVGLLCSKNLDYASEIITGPGTGSGPMTALALLCVGMTMTMLISYIVVRRRASELSEGLLAAPVGGEEESAAPYTQASP